MITREEIIKLTNEALQKEFELPAEKLVPKATFQTDLGLDSLDAVDMVVVLEQKFGFTLRQGYDIRSMVTLNDLYNFIEKLARENNK